MIGKAAAGTITDARAEAMPIASRFNTKASISQSYKKTLRTHMAFALAAADVAPLEDDDREDGEQHQVDHQGDPATSRIDQLGARIRTAKG